VEEKYMENKEEQKKKVAKAYEKYADQFTPKPKYFANCLKAFFSGGAICLVALFINNSFLASGMDKQASGSFVTIILVCTAQLLTGIGIFDTIAKFAGAGVIVPITGFANSMVAPAIEYKKEGLVLGVGAKLFSLAGPVLVCGISAATVIGIIYWVIERFF
jgi:stage V sporulation protein AC